MQKAKPEPNSALEACTQQTLQNNLFRGLGDHTCEGQPSATTHTH